MNKRQHKKEYWICKVDDGKMIYAGDTVELWLPYETARPYQSVVYWDRLHGALVDRHPSHRWMEGGGNYRRLSEYLNQDKQGFPLYSFDDDGNETVEYRVGYCKKVKSYLSN